ncbi:MAG: penicillin-binding protein 2 [Alphaproteobacteria bacterium]|nr:penicillin-binding protein 2 [Alphaproteobacteria bacterium]
MSKRLLSLAKVQQQAVDTGRTRLLVGAALMTLAFGAVGFRVVDVAVFGAGEPKRAHGQSEVVAARADIVDRNGLILATNLKTPSLYANPKQVIDPARTARDLVRLLPDLDPIETQRKLTADSQFVWIKRDLTPRKMAEINNAGLPGIHFQDEERRIYPQGQIAGHVIGYTDIDGKGIAGLEKSQNLALTTSERPARLSIDIRLQHLLRLELSKAIDEFKGIGGAGTIMDVRTGEILAMTSLPDFDPNHPGDMAEEAKFNRASLGVYELGSTFKIFNTAMALETGVATMRSGYDASQPIRVSRFRIRDYRGKNRWLSVPEIFMYSSNIGSAKMAMDVGTEGQIDFLKRLGMMEKVGIELPERGAPLTPQTWRDINTMTIAFGHGISVSPLHLVAGVGAMVNGGILRRPTLLAQETDAPAPGTRVIGEGVSENIRKLLRLVVENGTGRNASAAGYLVGGKTGTAEKATARGYARKSLISSFVAAFPLHEPRYVIFAMVDEPKGNKRTFGYATGGWVAAPVIKSVIERMGPMLGIPAVDEDSPEIRRALAVEDAGLTDQKRKKRDASF